MAGPCSTTETRNDWRGPAWFAVRRLCYTVQRMADKNDSVLDKAEHLARRVLERLGSKVDSKLGGTADSALSHREVSDLTSRIEREIEANLRPDRDGVKRVAPNRLRVGFTYERATEMSDEYLDALGPTAIGSSATSDGPRACASGSPIRGCSAAG